ncbi:hypothetical protein [Actinomyces bowdenii]|uniref:Uncharacterized protein n=1 Tax=Actinomyces bowdenii TaxID=131109 RepID=A0A3P1V9M9_9ACTO|nr:hypothetical protein [Actinomyces bowdenii]RRD30095.1 hypothetical protein EII10_03180 [Actinomyces bowdenii]
MSKQDLCDCVREGIVPDKIASAWLILRDDLKELIRTGSNQAEAARGPARKSPASTHTQGHQGSQFGGQGVSPPATAGVQAMSARRSA